MSLTTSDFSIGDSEIQHFYEKQKSFLIFKLPIKRRTSRLEFSSYAVR